ncbi:MAG: BTAD domain-containing putative transcriptional regulator, partial [Actinomycetota bacterium]
KELPAEVAETGSAMLLRGSMLIGVDIHAALTAFGEALESFRADGDREAEAIAQIRRSGVMFIMGDQEGMGEVLTELMALGEQGVLRAARSVQLMGAFVQLMGGSPREAIETVEREAIRADPELSVLASYLVANGSMELGHVKRSLAEAEICVKRATGHLGVALRGLVIEAQTVLEPHDIEAREAGLDWLLDQARSYDLPGSVATAAAGYSTWLSTKDRLDEARALLAEAQAAATGVIGPHFLIGVGFAEVMLAFMEGDEELAADIAERLIAEHPFGARPDRNYLLGFDLFYLLVPDTRELLDDLELGPDFELYRTLAQAVVALRESGDTAPARALGWERPAALRTSLVEPLLVELAVAAVDGGVDAAFGVFDELAADPHALLRRAEARYDGSLAKTADRLVRRIPARPVESVSIDVLGPLRLRRGDKVVDEPGWGRERVRSLLLYLVDAGRVRRDRVAAALWGDRDDEAALNNLRVTLNHLQQVLQPERDRSSAPFFLRVDGDHLELTEDPRLRLDVRRFESLIEQAAEAEQQLAPAVALERLTDAVELYRGEYLVDAVDLDWGYYDRIRFQSLFVSAATRAGELLLARGDARGADALAVRAVGEEPFAEPAHRLRARALVAAGDRAAARTALSAAVDGFRADGLEPEPATVTLLDSL